MANISASDSFKIYIIISTFCPYSYRSAKIRKCVFCTCIFAEKIRGTYLDRAQKAFEGKLGMTSDSIGAFLPKTAGKVESDALRQSATIDQNNVMVRLFGVQIFFACFE